MQRMRSLRNEWSETHGLDWELLAEHHAGLIATTGRKDRGVRRARFMSVVREQKRPAILVEGGFLSSPAEFALISRPDFREQMARAICNALPN